MQPTFQSSFIPKKPVTDSEKVFGPVTKNRNVFSIVATFLFVITLFVSGGLFVYQKIIEKQIKDADKELGAAREAFEIEKLEDLIGASVKINSIKGLLDKHFAVSELMVLLQRQTVKSVKFMNFTFKNSDGTRFISMDGEALSYNAIAKQSENFVKSGVVKNIEFSDFTLADTGVVKFKFAGAIDESLISYKQSKESTESLIDESQTEI
ncbi:MAG TPA: hypothetical protein VGC58_00070 [Candidatus Paceibacterota bacterium]